MQTKLVASGGKNMQLQCSSLFKSFGEKAVLNDVFFEVRSGEPLGLLGRNGAGKTTIMRIIMNILPPDSGSVLIDGKPSARLHQRLGYLPEERGLYEKMPIEEQLIYIARLRGISSAAAVSACDRWLRRLDLAPYRKSLPQTLSKGNQQRVQLAMALINDPDVVIFDEPFSGLDPINALQLSEVINELAERGRIIIISSHQMKMVESFCDHVVMLNEGKTVLDASLRQLSAHQSETGLRLVTDDDASALPIAQRFGTAVASRSGITVSLYHREQQSELLRTLLDSGLNIAHLEQCKPSLDDLFVSLCGQTMNEDASGGEQRA